MMLTGELRTSGGGVLTADAEAVGCDWFGLDASAEPLGSERDANFHLRTACGREFLLKFVNPAEPAEVTDFQVALTRHVSASGALPVPTPLPDRTGAFVTKVSTAAGPRAARLLTWVQGVPLVRRLKGTAQRRALGRTLATLDRALVGFAHPAQDRRLPWHLLQAAELRPLLAEFGQCAEADAAGRALDRLQADVLPVVPTLRHQVIHNDLNPHNVLVDPDDPDRITGVIDFGDSVHAPLAIDVAVAAAYHIAADGLGFVPVCDVVAGYHERLPLTEAEIAVIPDLMAVRLVATLAITAWRAQEHPENSAYILRNAGVARRGLLLLDTLDRGDTVRALHEACGRAMAA